MPASEASASEEEYQEYEDEFDSDAASADHLSPPPPPPRRSPRRSPSPAARASRSRSPPSRGSSLSRTRSPTARSRSPGGRSGSAGSRTASRSRTPSPRHAPGLDPSAVVANAPPEPPPTTSPASSHTPSLSRDAQALSQQASSLASSRRSSLPRAATDATTPPGPVAAAEHTPAPSTVQLPPPSSLHDANVTIAGQPDSAAQDKRGSEPPSEVDGMAGADDVGHEGSSAADAPSDTVHSDAGASAVIFAKEADVDLSRPADVGTAEGPAAPEAADGPPAEESPEGDADVESEAASSAGAPEAEPVVGDQLDPAEEGEEEEEELREGEGEGEGQEADPAPETEEYADDEQPEEEPPEASSQVGDSLVEVEGQSVVEATTPTAAGTGIGLNSAAGAGEGLDEATADVPLADKEARNLEGNRSEKPASDTSSHPTAEGFIDDAAALGEEGFAVPADVADQPEVKPPRGADPTADEGELVPPGNDGTNLVPEGQKAAETEVGPGVEGGRLGDPDGGEMRETTAAPGPLQPGAGAQAISEGVLEDHSAITAADRKPVPATEAASLKRLESGPPAPNGIGATATEEETHGSDATASQPASTNQPVADCPADQPARQPLKAPCTLRVLLAEGRSLHRPKVSAECFTRLILGAQTAYSTVLRCGPGEPLVRWNQEFRFVVTDPQAETLKVTVLDCLNKGGDLGRCQVPLSGLQRDVAYTAVVEPLIRDASTGTWGRPRPASLLTFVLRAEGFGEEVDMAQYAARRRRQLAERLTALAQEEARMAAEHEALKNKLQELKVMIEDPSVTLKEKIDVMAEAAPLTDELERFEAEWADLQASFAEQRRALRLTEEEEEVLRQAEAAQHAAGVARAAEEAFLQSLRQPPLGQEEQDAAAAAAGGAGGGQPWVALLHPPPPPPELPQVDEVSHPCRLHLPVSAIVMELEKHRPGPKKKPTAPGNPDLVEVSCITTSTAMVRWTRPAPAPVGPLVYRVLLSQDRGVSYQVAASVSRRKLMLTALTPGRTYHVTVVAVQEPRKTQGRPTNVPRGLARRKIVHFTTKPEAVPDTREELIDVRLQRLLRKTRGKQHPPAAPKTETAAATQPAARGVWAQRRHQQQHASCSNTPTSSSSATHPNPP